MEGTFFIITIILLIVIAAVVIKLLLKKPDEQSDLNTEDWDLIKEENTKLKVEKSMLDERIKNAIEEFKKQESRYAEVLDENKRLTADLHVSKSEYKNLQEKITEQEAELEKLNEKFTKEFKLVANQLLKENSNDISEKHQKELDHLLGPLKEKLQSFEDKIQQRYEKTREEQLSLKHEIKQLTNLNNELNIQAQNLTTALKGDNKVQGNWGELVLERILESSGLIKGKEYQREVVSKNAEQQTIKPDVIVNLPDERHIIIDSKVSLSAYEKFSTETDEVERSRLLKMHIASVKSHVKLLSEKNYQSGIAVNTPDFVLLFIPIESSFSLAIQNDPDLYAYAWDKKVVIVSPTTLLATLRTIASVWKHERQAQNAKEIADRAGSLYDKFYNFVEDLKKVGGRLQQAQDSYHAAYNKLSTGNGNLLRQTEMLKELGANTQKDLSKELSD